MVLDSNGEYPHSFELNMERETSLQLLVQNKERPVLSQIFEIYLMQTLAVKYPYPQ